MTLSTIIYTLSIMVFITAIKIALEFITYDNKIIKHIKKIEDEINHLSNNNKNNITK